MINAQILLDSINPKGDRLTTWILTYPRIILAEINTHRVLSRNTSSSRAIPVTKLIEQAKINPFIPTHWGKNQPGMQADEELDNIAKVWRERSAAYRTDREEAEFQWLRGRDKAVETAEALINVGAHKQIVNRVLEPWLYVTSLFSGTDWENVFALRAHKDAQPEFRKLAYLMLDLYQRGNPTRLNEGEWHIPFGDRIDFTRLVALLVKKNGGWAPSPTQINEAKLNIATARCARVSYLNFDGKDDYDADMKLTLEKLAPSGHWSAFEHCAEAMGESKQSGNFVGWKQYRKFFPNENRRDGRVQRYKEIGS